MDVALRTVALYQRDESLHTHTTKVVAVEPLYALSEANRALFKQATEKDQIVVTAETIFYAQGGGQPSDSGTMRTTTDVEHPSVFRVSSVRKADDGRILHLGRYTTPGTVPIAPGDSVQQMVDSEKRDLHSRLHTGGHVLGLAVRQLAESIPNFKELKASHYPDSASVEFQGLIDGKHKEGIQAKADDLIRQALPVKVHWLSETELRALDPLAPESVALPDGELIRAVDIVGAGVYPCGGTYVTDTSQVGKLLVKKISRSKGTSKVSYSVS